MNVWLLCLLAMAFGALGAMLRISGTRAMARAWHYVGTTIAEMQLNEAPMPEDIELREVESDGENEPLDPDHNARQEPNIAGVAGAAASVPHFPACDPPREPQLDADAVARVPSIDILAPVPAHDPLAMVADDSWPDAPSVMPHVPLGEPGLRDAGDLPSEEAEQRLELEHDHLHSCWGALTWDATSLTDMLLSHTVAWLKSRADLYTGPTPSTRKEAYARKLMCNMHPADFLEQHLGETPAPPARCRGYSFGPALPGQCTAVVPYGDCPSGAYYRLHTSPPIPRIDGVASPGPLNPATKPGLEKLSAGERILRNFIAVLSGVEYELEYPVLNPIHRTHPYRMDMVVRVDGRMFALEVDGAAHFRDGVFRDGARLDTRIARDVYKTLYCMERGLVVIRLRGDEMVSGCWSWRLELKEAMRLAGVGVIYLEPRTLQRNPASDLLEGSWKKHRDELAMYTSSAQWLATNRARLDGRKQHG
jgi:hypothetical protein